MRAEGSAVAGLDYSLFCEVTIPPFITVSETVITWTHQSQYVVGNSAQLIFSPLESNDEGFYTCTVHYLVNGIASPQESDSYEVLVSKSFIFVHAAWLYNHHNDHL